MASNTNPPWADGVWATGLWANFVWGTKAIIYAGGPRIIRQTVAQNDI